MFAALEDLFSKACHTAYTNCYNDAKGNFRQTLFINNNLNDMKYIYLLLFSFLLITESFAQRWAFELSFHHENNFSPKIDTIDYQIFERIKAIGFQSMEVSATSGQNIDSLIEVVAYKRKKNEIRMDSIFKCLKQEYPEAFQQKDSCLTLNGIDKQVLICNNRDQNDTQAWSAYSFFDYQKGYLVVGHVGYEVWKYILFNPKTRINKTANYPPIFVNDSIFYTSGNYYNDGGFQYMQITSNLYFGFETYYWYLYECYRVNNEFYFHFKSNISETEKPKYLKITF